MGNIVLIGMSGAGKSTIGVLLAKALGMGFVDTDIIIQQQEGRKLQEIIDGEGCEKFMEIEERILCSVELEGHVIATGGSAVYSGKAMEHLKKGGCAVYLHVELPQLKKRLGDVSTRGIVMRNCSSYDEVYFERLPLYSRHGDITVDCGSMDIEGCLAEVLTAVRRSW